MYICIYKTIYIYIYSWAIYIYIYICLLSLEPPSHPPPVPPFCVITEHRAGLPVVYRSFPLQFSCSVFSVCLWCHGLQHARTPCPSPIPGVYSNSCPLSWWCHPTISSSVVHFSSRLQCFPASGSFQMSQFFASSAQSIGVSASASVLPMNIQHWFPLG